MSWSDAKIHKGAAAHQLQNVCFAELDLTGARGADFSANGDGFQAVSFGQPPNRGGFQVVSFAQPVVLSGQARKGSPEQSKPHQPQELTPDGAGAARGNLHDLQMNEFVSMLAENFSELSRLREEVLTNSTDDMLRLVLAIAEKVIRREVQTDPSIILTTLEAALQAAIHADSYHVKVHPDDLAMVMEKKSLFMASISGLKNITMEGDATVSRGGCLVESELGQVDASIDGQLGELRDILLEKLLCEEEAKNS